MCGRADWVSLRRRRTTTSLGGTEGLAGLSCGRRRGRSRTYGSLGGSLGGQLDGRGRVWCEVVEVEEQEEGRVGVMAYAGIPRAVLGGRAIRAYGRPGQGCMASPRRAPVPEVLGARLSCIRRALAGSLTLGGRPRRSPDSRHARRGLRLATARAWPRCDLNYDAGPLLAARQCRRLSAPLRRISHSRSISIRLAADEECSRLGSHVCRQQGACRNEVKHDDGRCLPRPWDGQISARPGGMRPVSLIYPAAAHKSCAGRHGRMSRYGSWKGREWQSSGAPTTRRDVGIKRHCRHGIWRAYHMDVPYEVTASSGALDASSFGFPIRTGYTASTSGVSGLVLNPALPRRGRDGQQSCLGMIACKCS